MRTYLPLLLLCAASGCSDVSYPTIDASRVALVPTGLYDVTLLSGDSACGTVSTASQGNAIASGSASALITTVPDVYERIATFYSLRPSGYSFTEEYAQPCGGSARNELRLLEVAEDHFELSVASSIEVPAGCTEVAAGTQSCSGERALRFQFNKACASTEVTSLGTGPGGQGVVLDCE